MKKTVCLFLALTFIFSIGIFGVSFTEDVDLSIAVPLEEGPPQEDFMMEIPENEDANVIESDAIPAEETLEIDPAFAPTLNPPQNVKLLSQYSFIQVRWDHVQSATEYEVYRSYDQSGPYALLGTVKASHVVNYGYLNDNEAAMGKVYYYKVKAVFDDGIDRSTSDFSNVVSGVKGLEVPGSIMLISSGRTSIEIMWGFSSGAEGFCIYRSDSENGKYEQVAIMPGTSLLKYTDTNLKEGKTYYYKVCAYMVIGGKRLEGSFTDVFVATTSIPAPVGIKAEMGTGAEIIIKWDTVANADGYVVYRDRYSQRNPISTLNGEHANTYTDQNIEANTEYTYYVRAYKIVGSETVYGEYSEPAQIKSLFCKAPTNLTVEVTSQSTMQLTWYLVNGASGYHVYMSTSKDSGYTLIRELSGYKNKTATITGLKPAHTYYFKVESFIISGDKKIVSEKMAGPVSGKITLNPPAVFLANSKGISSIALSWSSLFGADGYILYRSEYSYKDFKQIKTFNSASTTSFTDKTGLKSATKYYYKIKGFTNVGGEKVSGKTTNVIVAQTKSNGPQNLKTSCTAYNQITLKWAKNSNYDGYQIFRSGSENGTYKRIGSVSGNSFVAKCNPETQYYFKIRGFKKTSGKVSYSGYSLVQSGQTHYSFPQNTSLTVYYDYSQSTSWIQFDFENRTGKDLIIYSNGCRMMDTLDSRYDRSLTLTNANKKPVTSAKLKSGSKSKYWLYTPNPTRYQTCSYYYFIIKFDGRMYQARVTQYVFNLDLIG